MARRKWAKREFGGLQLTDHARRQLVAEGYDCGMDGLGNYLDEDTIQDAAMDSALYHTELTMDGVPEGHVPLREAAADYIYEGMLKALKEKRAAGKRTDLEGQ